VDRSRGTIPQTSRRLAARGQNQEGGTERGVPRRSVARLGSSAEYRSAIAVRQRFGYANRTGCVDLVRAWQNQSRSPPRPSPEAASPWAGRWSNCTSVPMCTRHVSNEAGPMTEIGTCKAEKKQSATAARASPAVECDLKDDPPPGACLGRRAAGTRRQLRRDDGAKAVYIDQPTIPVGMTVETYRRVRTRHKPHRLRRLRRSASSAIRRAASRLAHRRRTGDDPFPRGPSVRTPFGQDGRCVYDLIPERR